MADKATRETRNNIAAKFIIRIFDKPFKHSRTMAGPIDVAAKLLQTAKVTGFLAV